MSIPPRHFFSLASVMLQEQAARDEAVYRTAVGRAYYACFLTARDQLFGKDGRPTGAQEKRILRNDPGGSHRVVTKAISSHPNMSAGSRKILADRFEQLLGARIESDYNLSKVPDAERDELRKLGATTWEEYANKAVAIASGLLADLEKLTRYP